MNRLGKNPFNGLYNYSFHLGKSLQKIDPADMELYFYLPENKFGIFGEEAKYTKQRSIDKHINFGTSRFDLWHCTTTLSRFRPFNKKTKFIFTFHDLNFTIEDSKNTSRNKRLLGEIQKLVDRADHLVAISDFSRRQAEELLNTEGKPFTIIHPGCSFITDQVNVATPAYIPAKPFLFSIGLVEPRKNFHVLMPLLEGNDLELVIAGINDHPYKNKVLEEATRFGISQRVRLTGPVAEAEKTWYYQNCLAFLFPSFAEGFGLPVIEAMYFGKPVFTTKYTSLPEIAGDAAYYFNSFDPQEMKKTFNDGMHHYKTTHPQEKIINRAKLFSYDRTAKETISLYRKMLAST